MKVTIIAIGDELLIGKTQDTNSSWLAGQLDEAGYEVDQIKVVGDTSLAIATALDDALARTQVVLVTGGLGPTRDDLTKSVLNDYFGGELVMNEEALEDIRTLFRVRDREVTPTNEAQAMIPDNCTPMHNAHGTAPGMWFEQEGKVVISMPGVPGEMRAMFAEQVLQKIVLQYPVQGMFHRHILTIGIPESHLSDQLTEFENGLPGHIKLAYLPTFQVVKLRLTARGEDGAALREEVDSLAADITKQLGHRVWGFDNDSQEGVVGQLCIDAGVSIGTAESCTAGYVGHTITRVPGSSQYYKGSIVSYADKVKQDLLNVAPTLIEEHGAVSEEVVEAMIRGAQKALDVEVAIAVTGIAGPDGGTADKPVGTVWIAVANGDSITTKLHQFGTDRFTNIRRTTIAALEMVRRSLLVGSL